MDSYTYVGIKEVLMEPNQDYLISELTNHSKTRSMTHLFSVGAITVMRCLVEQQVRIFKAN